ESFYTSDPGRALITGKCSDFNRLKGPILRGLAGRAPYFHNGAAATLLELANFYDRCFQLGLTIPRRRQLVAFLNCLWCASRATTGAQWGWLTATKRWAKREIRPP